MSNEPTTLVEAIRHFADPDVTLATMVSLRWPDGVCCPACGRLDVRFIKTRCVWECKEVHAKRQFTAKIGTIFEDSPLSLDKWFVCIWMVANCKNGVSSYEVHRAIGVTQKTAWFMLHRVRLAMQAGSLIKAEGIVEADVGRPRSRRKQELLPNRRQIAVVFLAALFAGSRLVN